MAASSGTAGKRAASAAPTGGWPERQRMWAKTGIVSLRELKLVQLPEDLFDATLATASVADMSFNQVNLWACWARVSTGREPSLCRVCMRLSDPPMPVCAHVAPCVLRMLPVCSQVQLPQALLLPSL